MNRILFLFLIISQSLSAQQNLSSPYTRQMQSISKLSFQINEPVKRIRLEREMLVKRVKISISTRVNQDVLNDFNFDADTYEGWIENVTQDDYLSIFKYDLRAKFYITRDLRFLTRIVVMGTQYTKNQYLAGLYWKF